MFEPQINILTFVDQTAAITELSQDLRPHAYLKFHPNYQSAFHTRLLAVVRQTATSAGPAGLLNDANLLAHFNAGATDFRRTLECEIMRWGYYSNDALSATDLPSVWQKQMIGEIDPITAEQITVGYRNGAIPRARSAFKLLTRESRLLNDIPPPVITVSGNNYTITQPGPQGRLFANIDLGEKDPAQFEIEPVITPIRTSLTGTLQNGSITITARVYRADIDGIPAWSAKTIFNRP